MIFSVHAGMKTDVEQPGQRIVDPDASPAERSYALITHLSPFLGMIAIAGAIPGLNVLVPLILWQVKKRESPFLDDHGREAVNFHISLVIIAVVAFVLTCGIAVVLLPVLIIFAGVNMARAAIAANKGEFFRYPCCIRMLG